MVIINLFAPLMLVCPTSPYAVIGAESVIPVLNVPIFSVSVPSDCCCVEINRMEVSPEGKGMLIPLSSSAVSSMLCPFAKKFLIVTVLPSGLTTA